MSGAPDRRRCIRGDRARKETLVEYGWRLPSALDNRPMRASTSGSGRAPQRLYVSARLRPTTSSRSRRESWSSRSSGRPDCSIQRSRCGPRVDRWTTCSREIRIRVERGERGCSSRRSPRRWPRTSPTTTASSAYGSATSTATSRHDRAHRDPPRCCGRATSTCSWGSTCCARGWTFPRFQLVAILDADKEGFLRSTRSLIQTIGRAARNVDGQVVILYADQDDRLHATCDPRGDRIAAVELQRRLQRGARHHPAVGGQEDRQPAGLDLGVGLRHRAGPQGAPRIGRAAPRAGAVDRGAAPGDEGGRNALDYERAAELRDRIRELEAERLGST